MFETWSLYVDLASMELTVETKLASKSQRSTRLCLMNARIKNLDHHIWLFLFKNYFILMYVSHPTTIQGGPYFASKIREYLCIQGCMLIHYCYLNACMYVCV